MTGVPGVGRGDQRGACVPLVCTPWCSGGVHTPVHPPGYPTLYTMGLATVIHPVHGSTQGVVHRWYTGGTQWGWYTGGTQWVWYTVRGYTGCGTGAVHRVCTPWCTRCVYPVVCKVCTTLCVPCVYPVLANPDSVVGLSGWAGPSRAPYSLGYAGSDEPARQPG